MPANIPRFTLKRSLLAILLAFPAQQVLAAPCDWIPASGSWSVPANWSCGNVPGSTDTAAIASGQSSTVSGGQGPTNVSNAGTVTVSDNSSLTLLSSNVNSGTLILNSVGNPTYLRISGAVALNGSGVVSTSNSLANRIIAATGSGDVLSIGSGQTMQGAGRLGEGGALGLVNDGSVVANLSSGIILNALGGVTNNSVLRGNGATLLIQNTAVSQGGSGVLDAINSGVLQLSGASITGGSFTTSTGGAIATTSGTTSTVSGVTNLGTLNIVDNSNLALVGTLTNNGSVNLQSVGNPTSITLSGAQTINGSGTINLSNTQQNRIQGAGATFTLGSGQTLQGAGIIGAGSAGFALANNGTMIASQPSALLINPQGGVTNTGTLRADGGTLQLQTTVNSGGGAIEARNGSQVQFLNGAVINNANFSASGAGSLLTTVSGSTVTLGGGTIAGPMTIHDNSNLVLTGDVSYNGTLSLASVGNPTSLQMDGARSLSGTATVQMSNTTANRISGKNLSGDSFLIGSDITVQGAGIIGAGSAGFALDNKGTMIATQANPLLINALGGVTNTGTMRADGGTLQLQTTVNSGGGAIEARNGSQVQFLNGAVINNANFSASGVDSLLTTVSGSTVTLGGGTIAGPMTIHDNSNLVLTGDVSYNGTLSLASVGNPTSLQIDGARSLSGTATVQMSNTTANRISGRNLSGDSLVIGSGITVQGAAIIGGNDLSLVNNGSLIATQPAGITLGSGGTVTNNNVIRGDAAAFSIHGTNLDQGALGVLDAINGGVVRLIGNSTITGGTFTTGSGGQIATLSGHTAGISGVTNEGTLNIVDNSALLLNGTLTNNGVVNMQSVGNPTDLRTTGIWLIDGTGTINLSNITTNRIVAATAGDSLTLGSGQTLQGAGQIGGGGQLNLTNDGTIIGNVSNALTISSTGTVTNNKTVRANDGTVTISGTNFGQGTFGVIDAINGGIVRLIGNSSITGGTFTTGSEGQIATLSGHTAGISGVTNTGTLNIVDNSALLLNGTLTNNGVINMKSVGNLTDLRTTGNRLIDGTGTINLSNISTNRIVAATAGDSLTLGSGQTLQGAGQIGGGGQLNFTNNGTIIGNVSNALTISSTGTVTNNKTVRANDGTVTISGTNFGQGTFGVIDAINGGIVNLGGSSTVTGGTFTTATGGAVSTTGGHVATIANVTNNGTFNVVDNSTLILSGTVTNNGALNLKSAGNFTNLKVAGNVTLGGTGITTLGNIASNRIVAAGASDQLTNGAGHTIQGSGAFGGGSTMSIVNQGTITANQAAALTIQVDGAQTVQNQLGGLMQATGGRTLNLNNVIANNGTIAANSGVVNASFGFTGNGTASTSGTGQLNVGAASTVGTLINDSGNANALSLGLNSITVSADYTNANSSSGNTFNRRANVTGAGKILAGGDVSQVISGAGVSNGSTVNATLTIGSVRVGDNTFNYQIGNAGSTGPTLRGAVQTTVNGGNLSDSRLSGSGVTASNYNAGGPGGNSGDLAVTFKAVDAGLLAPLTGQVLNLRSNFENIADQKLNIVLGTGAAAYNAAVGSAGSPVTVANQRIGGSATSALTISNTAPGGLFTEVLNAKFGSNTGDVSGTSGSITGGLGSGGVAVGTPDSSTMRVGVNTSSAGAKSGKVEVNFQSNGAGTSGLATIDTNKQTVSVSGNVYQLAQPAPSSLPLEVNLGNFRAGSGATSQTINILNSNAGAPAGFQEGLAAVINGTTGSATGSGFTNAAVDTSGALAVGLSGIAAGNNSGSVRVQLQSNGVTTDGANGLGSLNLGTEQAIAVKGTGWNLAQANKQPVSIDFGKVLQGSVQSQFLSIQNTAAADFSEKLDAFFKTGGTTGDATNNDRSIALLAAGAPANNTAMAVGINTGTIGDKSGQVIVSFNSNGTGTSGLGITGLADQNIGVLAKVEGTVGTLAQASAVTPNSVDFGNIRINSLAAGPVNLSISNMAVIGEGLNASIATGSTGFTASGAFTSLAPGKTDSSALQVGFDGTSSAGAKSGSATVTLISDGSFNGGTTTPLPSQTVDMTANVYRLANPTLGTSELTIAARVGDAVAADRAVSISNSSPDAFTEGLKVSVSGATGNAQGAGAIANLAAKGVSSAIQVGLASTAAAGTSIGTVELGFDSTGAGTTGAANVAATTPSGTVTVNGRVYTAAIGKLDTPTVDFGIVRVGPTPALRNVVVSNAAASTALNDTLKATLSGLSGAFSGDGSQSGIAAGASASFGVGLDTTAAGAFSQAGTLTFISQNPDMADISAGVDGTVLIAGQVNNLANADFDLLAGTAGLTHSGSNYVLDLGTFRLGENGKWTLELENDVAGPFADDLRGLFNLAAVDDFALSGWDDPVSALAYGEAKGGLDVRFSATALGDFEDKLAFDGFSVNASDLGGIEQRRQLTIRARVIADGGEVPEPGSLALLLAAGLAGLIAQRRRLATPTRGNVEGASRSQRWPPAQRKALLSRR